MNSHLFAWAEIRERPFHLHMLGGISFDENMYSKKQLRSTVRIFPCKVTSGGKGNISVVKIIIFRQGHIFSPRWRKSIREQMLFTKKPSYSFSFYVGYCIGTCTPQVHVLKSLSQSVYLTGRVKRIFSNIRPITWDSQGAKRDIKSTK